MQKLADISFFESIGNQKSTNVTFNGFDKPGYQEIDPAREPQYRGLSDLNADDVYDTIQHFIGLVQNGEITPKMAKAYLRAVYGIDSRQINAFMKRYAAIKQASNNVQRPVYDDRPAGYQAPRSVVRRPVKKKTGFFGRFFRNEKDEAPDSLGRILADLRKKMGTRGFWSDKGTPGYAEKERQFVDQLQTLLRATSNPFPNGVTAHLDDHGAADWINDTEKTED